MDRVPVPAVLTPADRAKRFRVTDKRREAKGREYEVRAVKRLEAYLARPFMAWDGEGINETDGRHTYCLIANSDGAYLQARDGLKTANVFELFLASNHRDVTHVIYGGGYDINMFLRDVPIDKLRDLYDNGSTWWRDYWMEWRGGKSFRVKSGTNTFTLYDVLPFFQRTFVSACDEYLGEDWEYRDEIIREKARRGNFDYAEIEAISEYNKAELSTLVRLCDALKERLYKVGIRVSRWDGPGAIATALYQEHKVKSSRGAIPDDVARRGRYAYAGGRFEIIRKGHSESGAYQYDIRSAYPAAIRHLPCLAHGEWRYVIRPHKVAPFGVYYIDMKEVQTDSVTQPQPLWRRNPDGTVYFSETPKGHYWSPEAQIVLEGGATLLDGYEWVPNCECNPFGFVEPMYLKRAALKKAGDGAHVGLKLGLNSLYGKLAQQVGWSPGPPLRIPPYHCLEWAGYITSHCRAAVYRAALLAPNDVIAFETDAIFSRVPLPLSLGTGLGEWEETKYESLTYLKSGMYFGTLSDGTEVEKCRGINKGTLTRAQVIDALARENAGERVVLEAEQTRFIGIGQAFAQDWSKWTHWITSPRNISVALNGKRMDLYDTDLIYAETDDGWQETTIGVKHNDENSCPYEVEWINPSPEMVNPEGARISEVRRLQNFETWEWDNE